MFRRFTLTALIAVFTVIPAQGATDEASALAVLASDADLYEKAMACDMLGNVGTDKAVPALAELLANEELHDYARDGLERIDAPAAGKALLAALKTLKGNLRVGVIITLGDRGEVTAVPALGKIAKDVNKVAAAAALSSLAQIATNEAGEVILTVLAEGDEKTRVSAAHAALAAAQQMENDGRKLAAAKMRKAVSEASIPAHIREAAGK